MKPPKFLVQILASFLFFFAASNGILVVRAVRNLYWGKGLTNRQANRVKSHAYGLLESGKFSVIVGSSMSSRLKQEFLGGDFVNLGLDGEGTLTGLEIIAKCGILPRRLVVEVNMISDPADPIEVEDGGAAWRIGLRRLFPAMRGYYSPSHLLARPVIDLLEPLEERKTKFTDSGNEVANIARSVVLERVANSNRQTGAAVWVARARELMDEFSARGVDCYLLWVPMSDEAERSEEMTFVRTEAKRQMPPSLYHWIEISNEGYSIPDGVHLDADSAQRCAREVVKQLSP